MNIDTNQIQSVITMITDNLGKAGEAAKPLALEYVRQYCAREFAYAILPAIIGIGFWIAGSIFCRQCWEYSDAEKLNDDDKYGSRALGCVFLLGAFLLGWLALDSSIGHVGNALAPLPSMLGK